MTGKKLLYVLLTVIIVIVSCATYEEEATGGEAAVISPEEPTEVERTVIDEREETIPVAEPAEREPTPTVDATDSGLRGAEAKKAESELEFMTVEEEGETTADAAPAPSLGRGGAPPSSSGLKAGFADDNRQYGYFVDFLAQYPDVPHYELDVTERILFQIRDNSGKPVNNTSIAISAGGREIVRGITLADGSYQFNPGEFTGYGPSYEVRLPFAGKTIAFDRYGLRKHVVELDSARVVPDPVPLDIVFILDTTGSMGEEIYRLRATIELIHLNLTSLSYQPDVRFGMVLYKDVGDEYDTRVVPLTGDLEEFRRALDLVEASGGGDTPENLQAALDRSMHEIAWNHDGIRLGFIITDAPPHLDYGQEYTYASAARDARAGGIKLFAVGTGGLPLSGEYVLRQIAQYTGGKYIFLTYGESGESGGGIPGSVSHHTGANYQTDKLEAIIIRFAKEELSYQTDQPLEDDDPYFEALKLASEEREETLAKLFLMAVDQLSDYSTYALEAGTVAAILPLEPSSERLSLDAEYFSEQMILSLADSTDFTIVDRGNTQDVISELKLQLSGLTDGATVAEVGKLLNAQVLVVGKLYRPDDYELFLRLLRVESGEVLSVTKAVIAKDLGINPR